MIRIIISELLLLAVAAAAWRWGGRPERIIATMMVAAAATNLALGVPAARYRLVDHAQLAVDGLLFLGTLAVALRANRFWPLWLVAIELVALGAHGVRAYDPQIVPILYARLTAQVVYPTLVVLALGIWHFQRRVHREGRAPADWSPLRL